MDAHDSSVLLKPRAAVVSTNLVVFTNRRAYRFDYTVAAPAPNRLTDEVMYAVRFSYPPVKGSDGESLQARVERDLAAATAARARNRGFWCVGGGKVASTGPAGACDDQADSS